MNTLDNSENNNAETTIYDFEIGQTITDSNFNTDIVVSDDVRTFEHPMTDSYSKISE